MALSQRAHKKFSCAYLSGTLLVSASIALLLICNSWVYGYPEKLTATLVDYEVQHEYPTDGSTVIPRYIPVFEFELDDGSMRTARGTQMWSKEMYAIGDSVAVRYSYDTPDFVRVNPAYNAVVNTLSGVMMALGVLFIGKSFSIVKKSMKPKCDVVTEAYAILNSFESKSRCEDA